MSAEVKVVGEKRLVVLGGAMLHEEDYQQVLERSRRKNQKFAEALADFVRDMREHIKRGG